MSDLEYSYTKNGDIHLAYQTVGEGPPDLVFIWGPYSNIEIIWEHPPPGATSSVWRRWPG